MWEITLESEVFNDNLGIQTYRLGRKFDLEMAFAFAMFGATAFICFFIASRAPYLEGKI